MIKAILRRLIYGYKCDSNTYLKYLRSHGATIGDDVNLFSCRNMNIDVLNLHLLTIGDHVNIVASTILTHDYAWSVIKGITGEIIGNQRPVTIGNNVFIGEGCIIMGGSQIEDNVIIGAHSVVSGHIEGNGVYAGNPARFIYSINDYISKRKKKQYDEARTFCIKYKEAHGEYPHKELLHEYFFLFSNDEKSLSPVLKEKLKLCGNYQESVNALIHHKPMYNSFDEFINSLEK